MPTAVVMSAFDLPTRSASGFLLRYIAPRVEPVQLFSFLARRLPFQLSAPQSDIIIGTGHGDASSFTGQNENVILEVGKYNPVEVRGKVIKLLSCQTGNLWGPTWLKTGPRLSWDIRTTMSGLWIRPCRDALGGQAGQRLSDAGNRWAERFTRWKNGPGII